MMNVDRLYIKGPSDLVFVPVDERYGLHLKWRVISGPVPKTSYDDIPGLNGSLDSTEEFGEIFYNDRSLALDCVYNGEKYHEDIQAFMSAYHGQSVQMLFLNDPAYYWTGRLAVSQYASKDRSLAMSAIVYPYKFRRTVTKIAVNVSDEKTVKLRNGRMRVMPEIMFTGPITLAWDSYTKALSSSKYPARVRIAGFELKPNAVLDVTITGSANVAFTYREGAL